MTGESSCHAIQEIIELNEQDLKNDNVEKDSWHNDHKHLKYLFVGGLDIRMQDEDVLEIFEQFGPIKSIHMIKDKRTGRSKGFGFIQYVDWRAGVLAIDNLNGYELNGRTLKVDHADYKNKEEQDLATTKRDEGYVTRVNHTRRLEAYMTEVKFSREERRTNRTKRELDWRQTQDRQFRREEVDPDASTPEEYEESKRHSREQELFSKEWSHSKSNRPERRTRTL
mmetsp:Transcript_23144/g.34674  ORF Transcript_23144/g.34674 Transcript_23144/m.34674 type:complete len:225 (-) Transcript_23144:258-932(-)